LKDAAVRNGFSFLSDKNRHSSKNNSRHEREIKISDIVYVIQRSGICHKDSFARVLYQKLDKTMNNFQAPKKPKFILFFSEPTENYAECIIANYRPKLKDSFYAHTSFGRIMKIRFCFKNKKIENMFIDLKESN
jgi:hypothetical protein